MTQVFLLVASFLCSDAPQTDVPNPVTASATASTPVQAPAANTDTPASKCGSEAADQAAKSAKSGCCCGDDCKCCPACKNQKGKCTCPPGKCQCCCCCPGKDAQSSDKAKTAAAPAAAGDSCPHCKPAAKSGCNCPKDGCKCCPACKKGGECNCPKGKCECCPNCKPSVNSAGNTGTGTTGPAKRACPNCKPAAKSGCNCPKDGCKCCPACKQGGKCTCPPGKCECCPNCKDSNKRLGKYHRGAPPVVNPHHRHPHHRHAGPAQCPHCKPAAKSGCNCPKDGCKCCPACKQGGKCTCPPGKCNCCPNCKGSPKHVAPAHKGFHHRPHHKHVAPNACPHCKPAAGASKAANGCKCPKDNCKCCPACKQGGECKCPPGKCQCCPNCKGSPKHVAPAHKGGHNHHKDGVHKDKSDK